MKAVSSHVAPPATQRARTGHQPPTEPPALVLPAFAKINLDLRVLGTRPDGYHDLRTVFQSVALHDTITFVRHPGPLKLECDDPRVPTDARNLVFKAAALFWQTLLPIRGAKPTGLLIKIAKRIPPASGLGGASANAAATLLGLSRVWNLPPDLPTLSRVAACLGADVPFFLAGGTALGLGRGDDIYPLVDLPRTFVVILRPPFGVLTAEAYRWFDEEPRKATAASRLRRPTDVGWPAWAADMRNELEPVVAAHHPTITRIKGALLDAGALMAAMSGSGSAVFGLFERPDAARRTAKALARPGWIVAWTSTLTRRQYQAKVRRALAGTGRLI